MMSAASNARPIDTVIDRLAAAGCKPKGGPSQWTASCPHRDGHGRGDKNPSLSVGEGPDGKALLHCHAGCSLPDVARSLDLALHDLFPDKPVSRIDGGRRVKATYPYYDLDGTLAFEVVKWEPKGFAQRRPDGRGGWTWSLKGIGERPLYHAPQVAAAIADGKPVWVTEGEKDAESLQWAIPEGATTTNSGGAGNWRPEYTRALAGAPVVNIVQDDDEAGLKHARIVATALGGNEGTRVVVWRPHDGHSDVSEHLGAGRGLDELELVWDSAAPDATVDDLDEDTDWSRIDLVELAGKIRDGTYDPITPVVLTVADASPLFYRERINSLFGESGGGKTWVALAAVAEEVRQGNRAAFIDYEDTPHGIAERLVLIGLTDDEIGRVHYCNPTTGLGMGIQELLERVEECTLVVLDSTGEAMASGSVNPNADEEVATWFRRVKELLKLPGGPAVVILDHVPKATDAPSNYAIGSQRKRAAITGASYRVDTLKEPAKGKSGKLKLTVAKDRPGNRPKGTTAAIVEVEAGDEGAVSLRLHLSDAQIAAEHGERFRPTIYMERVSRWLELNPGASRRAIEDGATGKKDVLKTALEVLIDEGFVTVEFGPRNAQMHTVIRQFREDADALVVVDNSTSAPSPDRPPTVPRGTVHDLGTVPPPPTGGDGDGGRSDPSCPQPTVPQPPDDDEPLF